MPTVPYEPPERYTPLEESDGERVSVTGYVSTFGDPPDTAPRERRHIFGFGAEYASVRNARSRHRGSVARRG